MNCKEFEKMIPDFLTQKLDIRNVDDFCNHMETCAECHEELVIQFLVAEGIQHLEAGDTFDLQKELGQRTRSIKKKVQYYALMNQVVAGAGIFAGVWILAYVLWILL